MFQTLEQPKIFLLCLFIGVVFGIYYEPFYFVKLLFKKSLIKKIIKIISIILFAPIFVKFSLIFDFPDFRLYMVLAIFTGALLYKVSFHKPIAILLNRVYNVIRKLFFRLKQGIKRRNERRKEKKSILGGAVRDNNANNGVSNNNNLSTRRNIHKKKPNRKVRCGDYIIKGANYGNSR